MTYGLQDFILTWPGIQVGHFLLFINFMTQGERLPQIFVYLEFGVDVLEWTRVFLSVFALVQGSDLFVAETEGSFSLAQS